MYKNKSSGFALVTVVVIVAILAIGIAVMLSSVKSSFLWSGFFRKKTERQNLAESGINLVKGWLPQQGEPALSPIDQGNTLEPKDLCSDPAFVNYCVEKNNLMPSLFILAEKGNQPLNLGTKKYRIFSQITQTTSNEKYTIEVYLTMESMSLAKIGFGMLHPTGTSFPFNAATFDGYTFFGKFPTGYKPQFTSGDYIFKGPVSFETATTGSDEPFIKSDSASVQFQKGYKTGVSIDVDPNDIFTKIKASQTYALPDWSSQELCLFVKDTKLERYACNTDQPGNINHINRYGAFMSSVDIPTSGLVLYSTENIEIKGIYDAPLTLASEQNIRLGGDLIARKQSSADYTLGLVAKNDVVIPHYVPNGGLLEWSVQNEKIHIPDCSSPTNGCTNFTADMTLPGGIAPTTVYPDRDNAKTNYPDPSPPNNSFIKDWKANCSDPANCKPNLPLSLDIEAAVFAVTGKLNVEGLNGPNGLEILGKDGLIYSLDSTATNYLYTGMSGGVPTGRKIDSNTGLPVEPVYCVDGQSPCPLGQEKARAMLDYFWLTGGLLVNDFSSTGTGQCPGTNVCGFYHKQITFNPRLLSNPPPGFPKSTTQVEVTEQWRKSYVGDANMMGAQGPAPVATALPTPSPTPCDPDVSDCGGDDIHHH